MIREKHIVNQQHEMIKVRTITEKPTHQTALKRIEKENEQLRVQKEHLKRALKQILTPQKWGEHHVDHIDTIKRGAVAALDKLVHMEEQSKVK